MSLWPLISIDAWYLWGFPPVWDGVFTEFVPTRFVEFCGSPGVKHPTFHVHHHTTIVLGDHFDPSYPLENRWQKRQAVVGIKTHTRKKSSDIKNYFLRGVPTLTHYPDIISDIPSGSIYGILSDILSDILSGILPGILSGLLSGMSSGPGALHSIRSSLDRPA